MLYVANGNGNYCVSARHGGITLDEAAPVRTRKGGRNTKIAKITKFFIVLAICLCAILVNGTTASAASTTTTSTKTTTKTTTVKAKSKAKKTYSKTTTKTSTKKSTSSTSSETVAKTVKTTVKTTCKYTKGKKPYKKTVKTTVKTTTTTTPKASTSSGNGTTSTSNGTTSASAASTSAGNGEQSYTYYMSKADANVVNAFNALGFSVKVNGNVSYSGLCDCASQTITLKSETDDTVLHELGHFLSFVTGNSDSTSEFASIYASEKGKYTKYNASYVLQNASEYFAESYREYVNEPETLKANRPLTYSYIQKCVSKVTDDQVAKIAKAYSSVWAK